MQYICTWFNAVQQADTIPRIYIYSTLVLGLMQYSRQILLLEYRQYSCTWFNAYSRQILFLEYIQYICTWFNVVQYADTIPRIYRVHLCLV